MAKKKNAKNIMKTLTVKMCRSHRILVITMFCLLYLSTMAGMIYTIATSDFGFGSSVILLAVPTILFVPLPLYYGTWQIKFDADGIQRNIYGIRGKKYLWSQIKVVRSGWLVSERNDCVSIVFHHKKTLHFRMDCDNAEDAKKCILSHCSIHERRTF